MDRTCQRGQVCSVRGGAARGEPDRRGEGLLADHDCPQSRRLRAADADVPRRTLCPASKPPTIDRILPLHLVWRGDRWRLRRAAGAADFQRQLRISDPDRAGAAVHARLLRRWATQGAERRDAVASAQCGARGDLVRHPLAAASDAGAGISSAARVAGGRDAVSAAAADALLRPGRPEFYSDGPVATWISADRNGPQFLWRP